MTQVPRPPLDLQARLRAMLPQGQFGPEITARATELLAELTRPARISILSPSKVRKAQLLNFLLGQNLLPPNDFSDVLQLSYSETKLMSVETSVGTEHIHKPPFDLAKIAADGLRSAHLTLPLPALTKISILAKTLPPQKEEFEATMDWLVPQTDIAIWFTDDFDAAEQALWDRMPNKTKDHSLLVLLRNGKPIDHSQSAYRSVFMDVVQLSTEDAARARAGACLDKALFRASGGHKLLSILRSDIDQARRHAADQTKIFLNSIPDHSSGNLDQRMSQSLEDSLDSIASDYQNTDTALCVPFSLCIQSAIDKLSHLGRPAHEGESIDVSDVLTEMAQVVSEIEGDLAAWQDDRRLEVAIPMLHELSDLVELFRIEANEANGIDAVLAAIQLKRQLLMVDSR
ncbi:hypothetical protein [uncultured Ruegeria sp.]|uniref:hypothetical protein n=1 Tax=uncultured Ruegeria sp. TaxID=259304 RepID=UPI002635E80F|nr:hypothetical protein [uncultured Ruegeria sp.]